MKTFSARETVWLQELDGIELAGFWRRAFAFLIDSAILSVIVTIVFSLAGLAYIGIERRLGHSMQDIDLPSDRGHLSISVGDAAKPEPGHKGFNYHVNLPGDADHAKPETASQKLVHEALHILTDVLLPLLYFGYFLWRGNGRTPGKRLMKIRVVSLVHTHMTFWHSVERALGYGAAALEGGFGFIQYFLHPYRRCAQDRLAETIVVTERSYRQRFPTSLGTPPEADTQPQEPTTAAPEPTS